MSDLRSRLDRSAGPPARPPDLGALWLRARTRRHRRRAVAGASALVVVLALVVVGVALTGSDDRAGVVAGPVDGAPGPGSVPPPPPAEPTGLPVRMAVMGGPPVAGRPTVGSGEGFAVGFEGAETWLRGTYADWEGWDGQVWRATHELSQDGPALPLADPDEPRFHTLAGRFGPGPDRYTAPEAEPGWYRVCTSMDEERSEGAGPGPATSEGPPEGGPASSSSRPAEEGTGPPSVGSAVDPVATEPRQIRVCAQLHVPDPDPAPAPDTDPAPTTPSVPAPPGEEATWRLDSGGAEALGRGATTFTALVTRLGCNGGRTGEVLAPEITRTADEVVVTFTVERQDGTATCPGNDAVPYEVDLGEAMGRRVLVDGTCRDEDLAGVEPCAAGAGLRWSPPG